MIEPANYRAATFAAPGEVLIRSLPRPQVSDDEVLLEVTACGVCGSDLALFAGEKQTAVFPLVAGHEIVGRVVEVGGRASALRAVLDEGGSRCQDEGVGASESGGGGSLPCLSEL